MEVLHYYRPADDGKSIGTCFNVGIEAPLSLQEKAVLHWLLAETFSPHDLIGDSNHFLPLLQRSIKKSDKRKLTEIGPRLNCATAWNTNAVAICHNCGLTKIMRLERSRIVMIPPDTNPELYYDRMTECVYPISLQSFTTGDKPQALYDVLLKEAGLDAFKTIPGLSMDDFDKQVYYDYFVGELNRNPTIAEITDLNIANCEHSRHGYFKGCQVIDGVLMPRTLMEIVKQPWKANPRNSLIAFNDNSSVIRGYMIKTIRPSAPGQSSLFIPYEVELDILFTAETHNFPTGKAPFQGAETGTGGRLRDGQATGRGGLPIAGTAGYCTGNQNLPGYEIPGEKPGLIYPADLATPLQILIGASNGASDYGNKYGEPVIGGFVRTGEIHLPNEERRAWLKPIMFTGGVGQIDHRHLEKGEALPGMLIVQIGGPAYRVGFGGGAASSLMQGENKADLDFNAVQRGDAEMEQKMNRVVRACAEMGFANPIISVHDQGAGGPANVLKELVEKAGGTIDIRKINVGDPTMSVLEIWVAEYQERNGLLIYPESLVEFQAICRREKVNCEVLGEVTGDGIFTVIDSQDGSTPVKMELQKVLGGLPQKTFHSERIKQLLLPLKLPKYLTVIEALEKVLRLPSVASKKFLTNKVDRSVTGLIAQQQNCGPLQLTVADVAVVAQSHFPNEHGEYTGAAISIGEQPIKMLVNPVAGARMAVTESLLNMVWAVVSNLKDIRCSANWMGAPKLPGEGPKLYDAAKAMSDFMTKLGIAVDGGKDSLSMATKVNMPDGTTEIVKSPLQLVISNYCSMPDITKKVTPDIKQAGRSRIMHIDLSGGKYRLGGSALAQCYDQIGNNCPDMNDPDLLARAFNLLQTFVKQNLILSGHDISDGGLIVTLLEMLFAGNCGFHGYLEFKDDGIKELFAEEAGALIEYLPVHEAKITTTLGAFDIPFQILGHTMVEKTIQLYHQKVDLSKSVSLDPILTASIVDLRALWEETSFQLEKQQCEPSCAEEEFKNCADRPGPRYKLTFEPGQDWHDMGGGNRHQVAILREEGSNGDREMTSAFYQAGFRVQDVTMSDLISGEVDLKDFRGVAFVGGFSYADVLDSAKGWAGVIMFNPRVNKMFQKFYERLDTFSLGTCNGCQLSALLGWVPGFVSDYREQPRFIRNDSGRFESRFLTVAIEPSPAIMLDGMAGSILGIWSANSEGKFFPPNQKVLDQIIEKDLAPIRYTDDHGETEERYPFNPSGSALGIAALCSPDGRHLAMMPHAERTFLPWQWAYWPDNFSGQTVSPWMQMFINARKWCDEH
jgi:phosphoribosylformylglycinamidine synthase